MRAFLDGLYRTSGALAAMGLVAICAIVLAQVGANLIDELIALVGGEPLGLLIPSYAEFAGFFLATATFLALAYTLRAGGHIRVSLVIQHLGPRVRHLVELACIAIGVFISGFFAYYTIALALESYRYGDVSPGMVPVALWIPQSAMALGLVVLCVALVDELAGVLRGRAPSYASTDSTRRGDD